MPSCVSRAMPTLGAALALALAAPAAVAADMPFFGDPGPQPLNKPVEFGSGWYLRGDVGYATMQAPVIMADLANSLGSKGAASGGVGVGYQYNSWLRADLTLDRTVFRNSGVQSSVQCPYGSVLTYAPGTFINGVNVAGQPAGYALDPHETCSPVVNSHLNRTSLLANVYVDLGNWWNITPYIGAGVGTSYLQATSSALYYQNNNGQLWAPNLAQGGVPIQWVAINGGAPIPPLPWAQISQGGQANRKSWRFSWNVLAGFSYDVSQNLKFDLGYRLLDAGSYTSLPAVLTSNSPVTKELLSHEIRLGFRLLSD